MPEFLRIARQYSHEGLNVVLIDDNEQPKAVQRFIDKFGIDFPVAIDTDGSVFKMFGFHAIPSSAFYNADGVLTPGLFVRIQLPSRDTATGVLVRDEAIGTDLDKRFVYVIGQDKAIAYRAVTLGPIVDGLRVIRRGLAADDVVVTRGLQRVRPGVKVTAALEAMEVSR